MPTVCFNTNVPCCLLTTMAKILLVEDDSLLSTQIAEWLSSEQHVVDVVTDGEEAAFRLQSYSFDLVILDWMLPGATGVDVCRRFRSSGGHTPILMLTGRAQLEDKAFGLDSGADDYLTKPFVPLELSARVRALLRRSPQYQPPVVALADLRLDSATCSVTASDQKVDLTPREYALLEFLMKSPNQYFKPEAIIDRIWSSDSEASVDVVKVYVNKLRTKLNQLGTRVLIKTKYGSGYGLEVNT
jgi:OmpR-family two-component system manganese-sensing response regulator